MSPAAPKTTRCTHCRAEFTDAEIATAQACPACGATGLPQLIADDVTLVVNWHELRILTIWAENWARGKCEPAQQRLVESIAQRLHAQHAHKSALSMRGEVRELQSQGHDVKLVDSSGKVIVPRRPKSEA